MNKEISDFLSKFSEFDSNQIEQNEYRILFSYIEKESKIKLNFSRTFV
jgi:hypothetical protein